ncbi:MAG: DUF1735 domain-containing protein [Prevotella sp.]|nr:DUF1735 domain-containing protein [Prevotella sp.]
MKKKVLYIANMLLAGLLFAACENGDWSFPDNDHTAVYFAYQSPIRTITLGEDANVDTSMDNDHQFQIMATIGGVYENTQNVVIDIRLDNSLCDGIKVKDGGDIVAMPATHYTLSGNQIVISNGKVLGGVTVQLTDAFFADPLSTELNYVIPVVMTHVEGADSILCGQPKDGVENPVRVFDTDWSIAPKDYTLYAVKYISKYQSNYLRRGVDTYTGAQTGTTVRHAAYVEKDEVLQNQFKTLGINAVQWARPTKNVAGENIECNLALNFDGEGKCTVTSNSAGVTATGNGQFVSKGDKNSWGDKDRDVLYLDYTLNYDGITCATKDTLVVRDRGVKAEWFTVEKK